jgi:hypothetical protein
VRRTAVLSLLRKRGAVISESRRVRPYRASDRTLSTLLMSCCTSPVTMSVVVPS